MVFINLWFMTDVNFLSIIIPVLCVYVQVIKEISFWTIAPTLLYPIIFTVFVRERMRCVCVCVFVSATIHDKKRGWSQN